MTQVLFCSKCYKGGDFTSQTGLKLGDLSSITGEVAGSVSADTPYGVGRRLSEHDKVMLTHFSDVGVSRNVFKLTKELGEQNVLALSETMEHIKSFSIAALGGASAEYVSRVGGFSGLVGDYQASLMAYRQAVSSKSMSKDIARARQKVFRLFNEMQSSFSKELKQVAGKTKGSQRGIPLTNPTRAANIAHNSRNVVKLDVFNQVQASNLVKLARRSKVLAPGLVVIDFGIRVGNVQNSYEVGGNWEREMFKESTSFVTSLAIAGGAMNFGMGFVLAATPVGWVGLVGIASVIAVSAASGVIVNNIMIKDEVSGELYDSIINWLST